MYSKTDYIKDIGRFLRTGDPSWLGEWAYRLRKWRQEWRCWFGLHWSELDNEYGRSWSEPGDPAWACVECGKLCYPVRWRFQALFWETRIGSWLVENILIRWDDWRHPYVWNDTENKEWCTRHNKEIGHK